MYSHLQFADVNKHSTTNYDELIDYSKGEFTYAREYVDFSHFGVTDEGILTYDGKEKQMIKHAFVRLCRQLKIPDPFAKHIPWELLKYNIHELCSNSEEQAQVFIRQSDGVIVNVARDDFVPVEHEVFINSIREHSPQVKRGSISDINMQIDITNPIFNEEAGFDKPLEIAKGDAIEAGLSFLNSTTGHNFAQAKIFLWRLVCTNGMTMPTKIGFAKLRSRVGRKIDVSVARFLTHVRDMVVDTKEIEQGLRSLNRPLNVMEFSKYWKGLSKVVRDDELLDDDIFQVKEEDRKLFMAQERALKKGSLEKADPTKVNGYRMVNNLTDKAKEFEQSIQNKLEAFGGKIVADQIGEA